MWDWQHIGTLPSSQSFLIILSWQSPLYICLPFFSTSGFGQIMSNLIGLTTRHMFQRYACCIEILHYLSNYLVLTYALHHKFPQDLSDLFQKNRIIGFHDTKNNWEFDDFNRLLPTTWLQAFQLQVLLKLLGRRSTRRASAARFPVTRMDKQAIKDNQSHLFTTKKTWHCAHWHNLGMLNCSSKFWNLFTSSFVHCFSQWKTEKPWKARKSKKAHVSHGRPRSWCWLSPSPLELLEHFVGSEQKTKIQKQVHKTICFFNIFQDVVTFKSCFNMIRVPCPKCKDQSMLVYQMITSNKNTHNHTYRNNVAILVLKHLIRISDSNTMLQ